MTPVSSAGCEREGWHGRALDALHDNLHQLAVVRSAIEAAAPEVDACDEVSRRAMADDALGGEDAGADLDVGLRIRTAGRELGPESSLADGQQRDHGDATTNR